MRVCAGPASCIPKSGKSQNDYSSINIDRIDVMTTAKSLQQQDLNLRARTGAVLVEEHLHAKRCQRTASDD